MHVNCLERAQAPNFNISNTFKVCFSVYNLITTLTSGTAVSFYSIRSCSLRKQLLFNYACDKTFEKLGTNEAKGSLPPK